MHVVARKAQEAGQCRVGGRHRAATPWHVTASLTALLRGTASPLPRPQRVDGAEAKGAGHGGPCCRGHHGDGLGKSLQRGPAGGGRGGGMHARREGQRRAVLAGRGERRGSTQQDLRPQLLLAARLRDICSTSHNLPCAPVRVVVDALAQHNYVRLRRQLVDGPDGFGPRRTLAARRQGRDRRWLAAQPWWKRSCQCRFLSTNGTCNELESHPHKPHTTPLGPSAAPCRRQRTCRHTQSPSPQR